MMRLDRKQLLAIVMAVLAVTAVPAAVAASSDELVVGSHHTTDSDFQNADTLDNVTVDGSGESASVVLQTGSVVDRFEDGDIGEYGGDTGAYAVQSDTVLEGSQTLEFSAGDSASISSTTGLPAYPSAGDEFSTDVQWAADDPLLRILFATQSETSGPDGYAVTVVGGDINEVQLHVIEGGTYSRLDGASYDPASHTNETMTFDVAWGSDGALNVSLLASDGSTVKSLQATDTTYSSGGVGFIGSNRSGTSAIQIYYDDFVIGETSESAQYVSPLHNVSNSETAAINVTQLSNVSVEATVRTDGGTTLNQTTLDGTGNHTLTLADTSNDSLETVLDVNITGSNPTFELSDESILFANQKPQVDNVSASPSGGVTVSATPVTLSIDVSDDDFSTAQGDEVTVEFRDASDDSVIGTDTLTSNGTATVEWDDVDGGENNWYAVAKDDYGGSTQSDTFSFSAPDELRIYNESAPTELVDNVTVELRFYYEDDEEIVERETTNGIINMTGLDPSQPFVVVAEADGYLPRRIYVTSLTETQEVFLLPEDVNYVEPTFELEDFTGDYPKENSVLIVQRSLNSTWKTVQGDFFGATGQWTAQLEYNERHRLILLNTETGDRETLGTYTPTTSGAQTVQVTAGDTILLAESGPMVFASPSVRSVPAEETSVDLELDPRDDEIDTWNVTVDFQNETTDETLYEESFDSSGGSVSPDLNLTDRGDGSIIVVVQWETAENVTGGQVLEFSVRRVFENDYSVFAITQRFGDQFPDRTAGGVTTFLAVLGTVLITTAVASKVPISTEVNGLVAVASVCGFWIIGWLPFSLVFATGTAWAAFATLRRGI